MIDVPAYLRRDLSQAVRSTSPRAAAAIAVAGMAVLLACSLLPPQRILSRPDSGDVQEYFRYAQRTFEGQVPYRDFRLEYPPGALPVLLAPGPADHGYYDRFRMLMLALGAAAIALLVAVLFLAGADAAELAAGVLVPATLPFTLNPSFVVQRYDLWPAALVLLALFALLRGRRVLGLVTLGIGAAAKLYPLALVPLAILMRRGRAHAYRELAIFAAGALVLVLPFAIVAPRGIGHVGWLLVRRPLHVESLGGSILLVAHQLGVYKPTTYLSIGNSWALRVRPRRPSRSSARWLRRLRSSRCGSFSLVGGAGRASCCSQSRQPSSASSPLGRSSRRNTWCGSRRPCRSRSAA
jgi:hypothetical protein